MYNIKISQIIDKLNYPSISKGVLTKLHANLLTNEFKEYTGTRQCKYTIVKRLNTILYIVISHDTFPDNWSSENPGQNLPDIEENILKDNLGELYISPTAIIWDIPITKEIEPEMITPKQSTNKETSFKEKLNKKITTNTVIDNSTYIPPSPKDYDKVIVNTPKSDLYLQPPKVPKLDVNSIFAQKYLEGSLYTIYSSLPIIPTKQNEISCTTNVELMTDKDLLQLYPNQLIQTRQPCLYKEVKDIELHLALGLILPIHGYTREELIDNIVKYPHIYKLTRQINGELTPFYSNIEINGELHPIAAIWKTLPEAYTIPYIAEFVKEYVVRRYLLERDVNGIKHKYPIFGELDPYLTLFMPYKHYKEYVNLSDVELARKCVEARVNFKRSRNPVLRRILNG